MEGRTRRLSHLRYVDAHLDPSDRQEEEEQPLQLAQPAQPPKEEEPKEPEEPEVELPDWDEERPIEEPEASRRPPPTEQPELNEALDDLDPPDPKGGCISCLCEAGRRRESREAQLKI